MIKDTFGNKETLLFDFVSIDTVLKEYTLSMIYQLRLLKQMLTHFSNFVSNGYNKFAIFHNFLSG